VIQCLKKLIIGLVLILLINLKPSQHVMADDDFVTHVVQPGETLLDLELFYGLTSPEITAHNVNVTYQVGSGMDVAIPVSFIISDEEESEPNKAASYVVQRGDTLFRIASQFGVSMDFLASANDIIWYDRILVGQELLIPGVDYKPPTQEELLANTTVPLPEDMIPEPTILEGKQIVVVLSQQKTYAFEDGVLVRHFVVSTGLPATPTVTGDYEVYVKYDAQRMTGPGYDLPGVPWVLYFYRGYALHGTYWHNNFGHPMSHGCVNMRTPEAEWIYSWAPVGTPVHVIP
jgi:lipoprotein-anchoring transpeptidase ErfK/SrfK